jgi:hypothetical protein
VLSGGALAAGCSPDSGIGTHPTSTGSSAGGGGGEGGSGGSGGATASSSSASSSASASSSSSSSSGGAGSGGEGGGGQVSACPPDADFDDIADDVEGKAQGVDTDGDGTPDYLDTDSDDDSLPDALEGQTVSVGCATPQNSDFAGPPDFRDTDSDDNGLPDALEVYPDKSPYDPQKPGPNPADTDSDGVPDYADTDNDDDSLPDTDELEAGSAVDTDGDGLPDLSDADSDGDTIGDAFEGLADPDSDGSPAYRDPDSDGDGLSDTCEAGLGHMLSQPPPDTDSDGKYDALDKDADGDGITDPLEDANLDCTLDGAETDRLVPDTDGDGTSDFIEVVLAADPRNPLETPATLGKYYFVLPYLDAPQPAENIVPLRTNLNQGDVGFLVDTTATMGGEIQNLKLNLPTIIGTLEQTIPDLAVGVAGFDDFPSGVYGTPGVDLPFYVGPTGYVSTALADNLGAVQALNVHDGGDKAESHVAAMHRALTDYYLIWDTGQMPPAGAPGGRYGTLRFRDGSLPILVVITDAPFHNGRRAKTPLVLHDGYAWNGQAPFPTPTIDDLVTAMKGKGARFVGISAVDGVRAGGDPYEDMAYLVDQSNSYVAPSAFGGIQCGTGLSGGFIQPDGPATVENPGGTCRLIFDISSNGAGLDTSVVKGVTTLLQSIKLDLRSLATPDIGDPIDAVDTFIDKIQVNLGGEDAAEPGVPCFVLSPGQITDKWSGPKGIGQSQDGVNETALGVVPGQKICFKIVPKPNTTITQAAGAQVFKAIITVKAKNGLAPSELVLGKPREIVFVVPPAPQ